jgi:hypothetical protein
MLNFLTNTVKVFIDEDKKKSNFTSLTIVSKNYLHYALTLRESFFTT